MPSLNALGQFKSSFNNIANEKADIESLKLPFDDLKLPTTEAPPFEYKRNEAPPTDVPIDDAGGADGFDVNSFLNDIPGGDSPPPLDMPAGGATSALDDFLKDLNTGSSETETAAPDTSGVDDFLNSLQNDAAPDTSGAPDASGTPDLSGADDFLSGFQNDAAPDTSGAPDASGTPDLSGADDFLSGFQNDAAPDETSAPDASGAPDLSGADDLSSMGGGQDKTPPLDDEGSVPDDLLSGFSDEMESAPTDSGLPDFSKEDFNVDAGQDESENDDSGAIDLGGENQNGELSSTGSGTDDLGIDNTAFDSGATDNPFGEPPSEEPQDFNDGIDMGGKSPDSAPKTADDDFSTDSLPDMNFPGGDDNAFSSGDDSGSDAGFDSSLPDIDFSSADSTAGDSGAVHDFGDLGADFTSDKIELDSGGGSEPAAQEQNDSGFSGDAFGGDEFSLSGLDDILNKSKASEPKPPPQKKGLFGRKKQKAEEEEEKEPTEENIDEISLSQENVDNLIRTLSSYPLNLKIICEELIAEQVLLPEQLSKLIRFLVNGASVKDTAALAGEITGKPIVIPKSFEKSSGAEFEAEQSSFAYIFVHNLLPVIRLFAFIAAMAGSIIYLSYKFIYIPIKAESLYKRGYERIPAGEYQRANELFHDAFTLHRKKKWFYSYAEAFTDQRRYMLAENKYDELLRYYPRDKKGVLDYAALNTYYLMNYDKANKLLQRELLDYAPNDFQGLIAAGDNFLDWADSNPSRFYDRYEDARFAYARLIEKYGWQPTVVERMLKYFIRTDNLKETLLLRVWFENDPKRRKLSPPSLAELGGYLLDKQLEKASGVPNFYVESIESVRAMLLQAIAGDPYLPEPHYHLARYHHNLGNTHEERLTLENAIRAFDLAKQETVKRRLYRVDTQYRYANLLIENREFFPADEQAVKGIELFEDFLNRNLIPPSPQVGQLYAIRGDLEYFVKTGNMEAAIANYKKAEGYGYAPPEIEYRMGAAYYQREDWKNALEYLFKASKELPLNRRLLFAMGNAAYQRGDYFAAQGYYNRLLDILEVQRTRLPVLLPNDNIQFLETGERLMMARNNAGVVNEALSNQTGNREYLSKAMVLYAESSRAWDAITRNPESMVRMRLTDSPGAPSINLGYLNANNALRPTSGYRPQIFVRIDKDALEPSHWEELAPLGGL
ncbi:periplasmic flagellar collar protein FlcA [Treponema sp. R80B11-R83G3]